MNPERRKPQFLQSAVERMAWLTILLIFIGLGIAGVLLYQQGHNQAKINQEIKRAVEDLKADKAVRDKLILDHVDCIGVFLSRPNRVNVRIEDLQNCKITSSDGTETSGTSILLRPSSQSNQQTSSNPAPQPPSPAPPKPLTRQITDFIRKLF
jgi:hypothetical protein